MLQECFQVATSKISLPKMMSGRWLFSEFCKFLPAFQFRSAYPSFSGFKLLMFRLPCELDAQITGCQGYTRVVWSCPVRGPASMLLLLLPRFYQVLEKPLLHFSDFERTWRYLPVIQFLEKAGERCTIQRQVAMRIRFTQGTASPSPCAGGTTSISAATK